MYERSGNRNPHCGARKKEAHKAKILSTFIGRILNKELLVEMRGVEPLSESTSYGTSPGAAAYTGVKPCSQPRAQNGRRSGSVAS